jgi:uncharacterized protein YigE (DUF2233 family)
MRRFLILVAVLLAGGCVSAGTPPQPLAPAATVMPSPTRTPVPADTGWQTAGDGIEIRELDVARGLIRERLFIARVDPGRVAFHVRYDPNRPLRVGQWLADEGARLAINGGFFDPQNRALGLLIADGVPFGQTYVDLGGLFGVREGRVQVRSLIVQPYAPGEAFDHMVQSFPTLLVNGAANADIRDDGRFAPRAVVGVDRQGRVVFLVSPRPAFSVTGLAAWLAQSDLDLDSALNLDGGTSSGLLVSTGNGRWGVDSWVPVPAVIEVR